MKIVLVMIWSLISSLYVMGLEEPLVAKHQVVSAELFTQPDQPPVATNAPAPPVIEEIRFLQFRYWSGTNWLDAWGGSRMPGGVEVSMASEPLPAGTELTEYPGEIFRRVIYLAGNGTSSPPVHSVTTGQDASGSSREEAP